MLQPTPSLTKRKEKPEDYRRRPVPPYDPFVVALPPTIHSLCYKMVDGVIRLREKGSLREEELEGGKEGGKEGGGDCKESGWHCINQTETSLSADDDGASMSFPPPPGPSSPSHPSSIPPTFPVPNPPPTPEALKPTPLNLVPVYSFDEFVEDYNNIRSIINSGPCVSFAYQRMELLYAKFNLHVLLNGRREVDATKSVPHR